MVAEAHRRWDRGEITKAFCEKVRDLHGMNWIPGGVSHDLTLRRLTDVYGAITFDWVHTCLQDGVLTCEAWLMLDSSISNAHLSRADIESFFKSGWNFPKVQQSKGDALYRVFSDFRLNKDGDFDKIRAQASELLGLYGLLRHFLECKVPRTEDMRPQWESFAACCDVMDWILLVRNRRVSDIREGAAGLRCRMDKFMGLHMAAYGTAFIKPKHHWLYDVADHWERDGKVIDCFVIERNHLSIKQCAEPIDNTSRFERSVLSQALNFKL